MKRNPVTVIAVATCLWIAVAGVLSSRAAEPSIEAGVPVFANHDKTYYRLPSLIVTSRGTVLAACQKRLGQSGDFAPSGLVLRRSRDGGKTFEPEQTLFERDGYCTFNGNLVEDRQSGTIFACFIAFPQAEHKSWFTKKWIPQGGGFSIVKSTDDGKTWSAPIAVMPEPNADGWRGGGAFNNNHGVQLQRGPHAGRLVICARVFKAGVYEGRAKGGLIYSDDHGATWRVGGVMFKDCGDLNGEVTVGETPDGEVYVNSRNSSSKLKSSRPSDIVAYQRLYSRSRDGGESFYAEGCHPELFDGPCNAGQTRLGELMLFTAPAVRERSRLTGYVSRDGGRTWTASNVISKDSGGYSDVAVMPDKMILTLYENTRSAANPRGMLFARYNLEWLIGKK